jgi:hypothetical protein
MNSPNGFRRQHVARFAGLALAALALTTSVVASAGERDAAAWDGLVRVKSTRLDSVQLLPGADFRGYTKVMIDPAQVAFKKNWLRTINSQRTVGQRVSEEDAERIATSMRSGFQSLFARAFRKAGFDVVTEPGADVLRLAPAITDVYINAPDVLSDVGRRVYTVEAGEATLALEAHDSVTGALLGRAVDKREARAFGPIQLTNSVTNQSDFEQVFSQWADICVKGLKELRQRSPVKEPEARR